MTRVAIVTGGTRGIGAASAKALKKAGYKVGAVYCGNDARALAFREETGIPIYKWNVADYAACEEGVRRIESELGPPEVLVNNAGITHDMTLHKMTPDAWHEVLEVNLSGCFNMCRTVIDGMRGRRFGRIVNVSSVNGQQGQLGQTNYCASKAGLLGFTKALARECAPKGITVNAVAPGYIDTDMVAAVPEPALKEVVAHIPVGRLGQADEVARAVLFLAADDAGFITGATLSVNGGQYME